MSKKAKIVHWYIPLTGHTGSFCGRDIAPIENGVTRLTNEPMRVTCSVCIRKMAEQGHIVGFSGNKLPENGDYVMVVNRKQDKWTNGFMVVGKHIEARKPIGTRGKYHGWVPGGGGDLWWIEHDDGSIGAYCYNELAPA